MNMDNQKWRELSVEEHKQRALNILLEIDNFCRKENLRYYLAFGTLIGAVRHKGFIPWDDDIDLQMPRPDYEVFTKKFNSAKHNGNYEAFYPTDAKAKHTYIKVCDMDTRKIEYGIKYNGDDYLGVDVDVFPLDGLPEDDKEYKKHFQEVMTLTHRFAGINYVLYTDDLKWNFIGIAKRIFRLSVIERGKLLNLFHGSSNRSVILKKLYEVETEIPFDDAEMVGTCCSMYDVYDDRYLKSSYDECIDAEFEGHLVKIPSGYDAILTKQFGDYMTPPPENQQITHHSNNVYVKK